MARRGRHRVVAGLVAAVLVGASCTDDGADAGDDQVVEVPTGGHTVSAFDDCTKQARAGFWTDPSSTDLPACVDELAARPFVIS